jgi:hypothetical protein
MAKRIELRSSMVLRVMRLLDFDCRPDVVTLIQTPTEQQKRVKGRRRHDALTLFLFLPASPGRAFRARIA